jgi:hypothetical protein
VRDSRMLARKIGSMAPATSVKLGVLHKGSEKTVLWGTPVMANWISLIPASNAERR